MCSVVWSFLVSCFEGVFQARKFKTAGVCYACCTWAQSPNQEVERCCVLAASSQSFFNGSWLGPAYVLTV